MAREAETHSLWLGLAVPKLNLVGPNLCESNRSLNCVSLTLRESIRDLPRWCIFLHYSFVAWVGIQNQPPFYQVDKEVQRVTIIGVRKP